MGFVESVTITCKKTAERAEVLVNDKDLSEAIAEADTPEKISELSDAIKDNFKTWSDWIDEAEEKGAKLAFDKGYVAGATTALCCALAAYGCYRLVKYLKEKKEKKDNKVA